MITTALRSAQETIATTAQHAQTAQLQLAAHDQLLFTARQKVGKLFELITDLTPHNFSSPIKVDALSAQLVGLQAEVGISGETANINLPALLDKLKEPLHPDEQPKLPASLLNSVGSPSYTDNGFQSRSVKPFAPNWNDYKQYLIDQQQKSVEKSNVPSKLKRSNFDDRFGGFGLSNSESDRLSSEKMKELLEWIHEENRKDEIV